MKSSPAALETSSLTLLKKIQNKTANVLIFGAGYVGLPLAVKSAEAGFPTIVYDNDQFKIQKIERGELHIPDICPEHLKSLPKLRFRWYLENIGGGRPLEDPYPDIIIICVPTPLNKTKDPDISCIMEVVEKIQEEHILWGDGEQLVILESTVYPGFTRECLASEFSLDHVLFAFSPERIDPGNPTYNISNTPKLVGGITPKATEATLAFYKHFIDEVVPVKSCEVAETAKLLENTYRMVNIGLANEFALMCQKLNISVWDVIEAASTKPFGFTPFYPGPGIGGHCVPVDPHYLEWKLRTLNHSFRFVELAEQINSSMPRVVVDMMSEALNKKGKAFKGSRVLVVGVAYKPEINDTRESPATDIIELLRQKQARVHYYDPHVPRIYLEGSEIYMNSVIQLESHGFDTFDCAVIVSGHKDIDYNAICKVATTIVDTRNVIPSIWKDRAVTF